ncbi:MAG: hypothetical protein R3F20_06220 [Planctomycetota bacterium]
MLTHVDWRSRVSETPTALYFDGLERLAPSLLRGVDLQAWLSAPLGGVPLYRRLFEPLVGAPSISCIAEPGRVANVIADLTRRRPAYGRVLVADIYAAAGPAELVAYPAQAIPTSNPPRAPAPRPHRRRHPVARPHRPGLPRPRALRAPLDPQRALLFTPSSVIPATTKVLGRASVGADTELGPDVTLGEGAIIGDRCHIGAGAHLENCVVLEGSIVPPGIHLDGNVWFPQKI